MSGEAATAAPEGPGTVDDRPPPLVVRGLGLSYGHVRALSQIDLAPAAGRITCVMGRNGVGKTSLLRAIMGSLAIDAGTVELRGIAIGRWPAYRRARAGIALVPQGREIFPRLTVRENLAVGLSARADRSRAIPEQVLGLFPILATMAGRLGGDLSGGQQQQLAIARALVGSPHVLLLDEPTEGIQPNIVQHIGVVLRSLAAQGLTIVLVEQYLDFVREIGDAFAIMDRGQIVARGDMRDLHPALVAQHLSV